MAEHRRHIIVFFIFLVSNMGGCLTPIGDPPLLMGFMRGVPFFWSLHLTPVLLFNMALLLFIFYWIDRRAYRTDIAKGLKPDISKPGTEIKIRGAHNMIFIVMIVAAVILSGTLPSLPMFQDAEGKVLGIHILGEVVLSYPQSSRSPLSCWRPFYPLRPQTRPSAGRTILPGAPLKRWRCCLWGSSSPCSRP